MAHRQRIDVQVDTRAAAGVVHGLLRDGASWPGWTSIDSFQLERAGDREPEGAGAIRVFRKGRVTGRDQVVEQSARGLAAYAHRTASRGY